MKCLIDFSKPIGQQFLAANVLLGVPDSQLSMVFDVDIADLNTTDYSFAPNSKPNVQASDFTKTATRVATDNTKSAIMTLLNSSVGVKYNALTQTQQNAVLVGIAHTIGAIGGDGTVQPLQNWLK